MGTPPYQLPDVIAYSTLLHDSFAQWLRRPLIGGHFAPETLAKALYEAPFVLVSHGTEEDPIFRYANREAQILWGIGWEEFIHMPSRFSAERVAQEERKRLLNRAARHGYIGDYSGVRIAKNGKRFEIRDTVLWNVVDANGNRHGQAAMFSHWKWL